MAKDERDYKGPGKFTAAVGRGEVEAIVGGVVGAVAGTAVGAITHRNKAAEETMVETEKGLSKFFSMSTGAGIGNIVGSIGGFVHGAYRGVKNVGKAKEQVADLNAQVDALSGQLHQQKSFVDTLVKERHAAVEAAQAPEGKAR